MTTPSWFGRGFSFALLPIAVVLISCGNLIGQPGAEIWKYPTSEAILASPALGADGTIYVGSYDRNIYALTPQGSVKWITNLPPPTYIYFATYTAVYGTPAVGADGTLYVPSENGKLLALNPTNGTVLWTYATTAVEGLYSSPAIASDGTIYFGSYDANFYAINPNGTRKWFSRFDSTIFASPVVGRDGTIYSGCDDGKLYALNPTNGARKWTFVTGTSPISAAPAIGTNGTLYVGVASAANPRFYSVSTNGTTNWVFTAGGRIESSAAIGSDGTIYFGCGDHKLYALNPDGTQKWAFTAGGAVRSSPAIAADGTVYVGCDDGKLYAIDAAGNQLWTFQTGDSVFASPAIGPDGAVYIASGDGSLYALRGCQPAMVSDWPMFGHDPARTGRADVGGSNHPPMLAAISDRTIAAGTTLTFANSVSDPDASTQISFSLGIGAPAGAAIDATTGVFQWTPAPVIGPTTNVISIVATDNGSPPLTDARCFSVVVNPRVQIESIQYSAASVAIHWRGLSNRTYRVQFKTNLDAPAWSDVPGDVAATNEAAMKIDTTTPGVRQRFYRVELRPSAD